MGLSTKAKLGGAICIAAGVMGGAAAAQDRFVFEGEVGATLRYYPSDGLYVGQDSSGISPIIDGRFSATGKTDSGEVVVELSGRYDFNSDDGYADVPRGYYRYFGEGYDVLIGSNIEYWGVSEGHQVVDVINQTFDLGNPVDTQSLGQPMLNVNFYTGQNSALSLYALLGFRERDFGDRSTRFRAPLGTSEDAAFFEEGNNKNLDFAIRYQSSRNLGNASVDYAVSYFNGTDRTPKMLFGCINESGSVPTATCDGINNLVRAAYEANPNIFGGIPGGVNSDAGAALVSNIQDFGLVPYYQKLQQLGLELVYSRDSLQLTFEGAVREAMDETYFSGIVGAQYNFENLGGTGSNLLVIGEYLYDDRSTAQPYTVFDNDIFLGFVYGANDVSGTSLSGGFYYDLDTQAKIYSVQYSRRLSDSMRLDVSGFAIDADDYSDPLAFVDSDGYVDVSLRFFF